jgi:CBS domain-containing protein
MLIKDIKDVMTHDVKVVLPETSIQAAAQQMRDLGYGCLPVSDGEKLKGMITDRDIVIRGVAEGKEPMATTVADVMSQHIVYVYEDQDVLEAARIMEIKGIRRLVVLNRDKRLTGILTLGDVSRAGGDRSLSGEILETLCEQPAQHATH